MYVSITAFHFPKQNVACTKTFPWSDPNSWDDPANPTDPNKPGYWTKPGISATTGIVPDQDGAKVVIKSKSDCVQEYAETTVYQEIIATGKYSELLL